MARTSLTAPLASIRCEVDATVIQAADCQPGPVVCPTCNRWIGVAVRR